MENVKFKKLDAECYLITHEDFAINMYARKYDDLYCVDIADKYFEEHTFKKVKEKVIAYLFDGQLRKHMFEIN
jgi:hypothetical protein